MKSMLLLAVLVAAPVPVISTAGAQSDTSAATSGTGANTGAHVGRMQEQVQRMQVQMDRMQQAQDPQARQEIMAEHMQTMQAMYAAMHGSAGAGGGHHVGMMGGGQHGGGMMGGSHGGAMHAGGQSDMLAECMAMMQQQPGSGTSPEKR